MRTHHLISTFVIGAFCSIANASLDVDQRMLGDFAAANQPLANLTVAERLLAATGSMHYLPLRQRVRAQTQTITEAAQATTEPQTLRIDAHDGVVSFSHDHIQLQQGESLTIATDVDIIVEAYVRDDGIAAVSDNVLTAGEAGNSEVIFIVAKTLHILPLTVEEHSSIPKIPAKITTPAHDNHQFYTEPQPSLYGEIEIQLVDERSYDSYSYPADNVALRVIGAEDMELRTDAQGKVRITGMPLQGRILVKFNDPRYVAGFHEITLDPDTQSYRLIALRTIADDHMVMTSGLARHAQSASMCGELEVGEALQVETDVPADGVFYFNKLGLLDTRQRDTAEFPRFCILNADPGPMTVFVKDEQGEDIGVYSVSLAAGHHTEAVFNLWSDSELQLHLSASGIATTKQVANAEVRLLGAPTALSANDGIVHASPSYHQQRSHLLVVDASFEQTLHTLVPNDQEQVLSLLPRGTLARIALQANVPYDERMGSVYAEVSHAEADDIRLIAVDGDEILPTWLDAGTSAAFLNLPFGVYQLLVRNSSGHWLAVQTVLVYDEAISYLRVGHILRYRAPD